MSMDHQFGAMLHQHIGNVAGIGEALARRVSIDQRRVMQQNDAKAAGVGGLVQDAREPIALRIADAAGSEKRGARNGGIDADQRDTAAMSDEREARGAVIAAEVVTPQTHGGLERGRDVSIVIARHQRNPIAASERLQPPQRVGAFVGQSDVGQIAGDRNVIRGARTHIRHDRIQRLDPMHAATPAPPRQISENAFVAEVAQARTPQRRQVRI